MSSSQSGLPDGLPHAGIDPGLRCFVRAPSRLPACGSTVPERPEPVGLLFTACADRPLLAFALRATTGLPACADRPVWEWVGGLRLMFTRMRIDLKVAFLPM